MLPERMIEALTAFNLSLHPTWGPATNMLVKCIFLNGFSNDKILQKAETDNVVYKCVDQVINDTEKTHVINDNDNNDIFIILTGTYIVNLCCIISLKLLPSPEELISQFKTSNVYNLCIHAVHA